MGSGSLERKCRKGSKFAGGAGRDDDPFEYVELQVFLWYPNEYLSNSGIRV